LGFSLLYGITGQVVSDTGESLEDLEDELHEGLIEFFLAVIVPRLTAIHQQLCQEEISRVEKKKLLSKSNHKPKRRAKKGRGVPPSQINEPEKSEEVGPPESLESSNRSFDLKSHVAYKSSFGSLSVTQFVRRGGVFYPFEWLQSSKPSPGRKKDFIVMSLLRHITCVLNCEILGLWHSLDQMFSLLVSPVSSSERLVFLLRSWYIWMVIDEATLTPCYRMKIQKNRSKKIRFTLRNKTINTHQLKGWDLVASSLAQNPIDFFHTYLDHHLDSIYIGRPNPISRYIACGQHNLQIPALVTSLLTAEMQAIRNLLDSTEDDEYFHSHLAFLLRMPWILNDTQRLEYVIRTVEDREEYQENYTSSTGYEIHLNRFTSPVVWAESILQQLLLEKYQSTKNTSLSILYQGEAGVGPGPIKEFLEMCRVFFDVKEISANSLTNLLTDPKETDATLASHFEISESFSKDSSNEAKGELGIQKSLGILDFPRDLSAPDQIDQKRPKSRKGSQYMDVPLVSIFPLFRPAGPSFPESIVPLELEIVVDKILQIRGIESFMLAADRKSRPKTVPRSTNRRPGRSQVFASPSASAPSVSSTENSSVPDQSTSLPELATSLAKKLFECVGMILGFSLIHSTPIGVGLPPYLWNKIILPNQTEKEKKSSWIEYCGSDQQLLSTCRKIMTNLSDSELISLELSFVGHKYLWNPSTQSLSTVEWNLLPNGSNIPVTPANKLKYIQAYTKLRSITPGMELSLSSIRAGLRRIISQDLLNILNPPHISSFVHGDVTLNITQLQRHVQYGYDYSPTHKIIKLFWYLVQHDLTEDEKRKLLLFWTGNSVPSSGGYGVEGGDYDEMTIAKKHTRNSHQNGWLPEAQTCEKKLYLPEYRSYDEVSVSLFFSRCKTLSTL
jgi:hypothetical protein